MENFLTVKELKAQGSLVELLNRLGFQPVPNRGREKMYHSMIRDNDHTPSFSVNDDLGVWFDHGLGKGGNIIDFGMAYWKHLSFEEVIRKIQMVCMLSNGDERMIVPRKRIPAPQPIVEKLRPLGTHPAITEYLKGRGVFEVAKKHLREVYYYIEDDKNVRKHYFAAGWQNEQQSWEVRNKYFKGCLGHKAVTLIPVNEKKAAVFEGFLDFLSWRLEHPGADHTVIVLNSLSLLHQGIRKAKEFATLDVFFDRDKPGSIATREFLKALPYATDRSKLYEGYNDYNDKIKVGLKQPVATAREEIEVPEQKLSFKR